MERKLFIVIAFVMAVTITGCGNDAGKRASDAGKAYDSSLIKRFQTTAKTNFNKIVSGPIQKTFADEYVKAYSNYLTSMTDLINSANYSGVGSIAPSSDYYSVFSFDSTTIGAFADMYNKKQIDGIRVYLARYTKNAYDETNAGKTNITAILVGTKIFKDSTGKTYYKDTLVPIDNIHGIYRSLQDYNDPCKPPPPCSGVTLGKN